MDTSIYDAQVAELQAKRTQTVNALRELAQTFRETVKPAVSNWVKDYIDRIVTQEDPGRIAELDQIGQRTTFQQNAKDLAGNVPSDVEMFLASQSNWAHLASPITAQTTSQYIVDATHVPAQIDKAIKRLLGKTGALLIDYEFIRPKGRNQDWRIEWNNGERSVEYGGTFPWSPDMKIAMKKYSDELSALAAIDKQIADVEQAKTQAHAQYLWNKQG